MTKMVKPKLSFPDLVDGRIYRREQVAFCTGTQNGSSDFDVFKVRFPWDLSKQPIEGDWQKWRDPAKLGAKAEIFLQYREVSMCWIAEQVQGYSDTFMPTPHGRRRIEAIEEKLRAGELLYPVFIQAGDSTFRIIEGNHRVVAWHRLGSTIAPAFLAGYYDWFEPNVPIDLTVQNGIRQGL